MSEAKFKLLLVDTDQDLDIVTCDSCLKCYSNKTGNTILSENVISKKEMSWFVGITAKPDTGWSIRPKRIKCVCKTKLKNF